MFTIKFTKSVRSAMMRMSKSELMHYLADLGCDMSKVTYVESKHGIPQEVLVRQGWNAPVVLFDKNTRRVSFVM